MVRRTGLTGEGEEVLVMWCIMHHSAPKTVTQGADATRATLRNFRDATHWSARARVTVRVYDPDTPRSRARCRRMANAAARNGKRRML